jgi:hypothetical protein
VQIPVLAEVEGGLSFGEQLEQAAEPALGPESPAGYGRPRPMVPRHQTQDLARVAIAIRPEDDRPGR